METNDVQPQKVWFRAKRFGLGWVPVTWQGWAVTLLYCAVMIRVTSDAGAANPTSASDTLLSFAVPFIIFTSLLVAICYAKGDKPKWRWSWHYEDK